MACELHDLPLLVCLWAGEESKVTNPENTPKSSRKSAEGLHTHPLLPIAVFQIVDGASCPVVPYASWYTGQTTFYSKDNKVRVEASESLDHTCGGGGQIHSYKFLSFLV